MNTELEEAKKQIAVLRSALVGLTGASEEHELRQMENNLQQVIIPAEEKEYLINAIRALIETMPGKDQ